MKGQLAAMFVLGYIAALTKARRKIPKEVWEAGRTAAEVVNGGTLRGPLVVWEMETVAERLLMESRKVAEALS